MIEKLLERRSEISGISSCLEQEVVGLSVCLLTEGILLMSGFRDSGRWDTDNMKGENEICGWEMLMLFKGSGYICLFVLV